MTEPYYADDFVTLYHGDCLDVLAGMPSESVDAIVTDPPYGLEFMGKEWDSFKSVPSGGAGNTATGYTDGATRLARPSFTGSPNPSCLNCKGTQRGAEGQGVKRCRCDSPAFPNVRADQMRAFGAWCELWAIECLRVLKPGGHLLAFGGTRTWHRLAVAVEDAGFEMRDSIAWLYGSGFPKSLDVSKAIDKIANVNDETHRRIALVAEVIRTHREAKGMERAEVSRAVVGTPSGACWNWEHHQLPSVEMWPAIKHALDVPDKYDGLIEGTREMFIGAEREVIAERRVTDRRGDGTVVGLGHAGNADITAPATPDAERWQGWGTALKPAFEPVVVARKPLAGTVAANVLAWGTGALNVDATRVTAAAGDYDHPGNDNRTPHALGRWPANVVLDERAAAELDRQSGPLTSGANPTRRGSDKFREAYGDFKGQAECTPARGVDSGGASRFFYTAKATSAERPRVAGVAHPTVKPLDLMRWLVRLVTPPGGTVLDPFAGSGTTLEAAIVEGFRCIGIEREADYLPLVTQRIDRAHPPLDFSGGAA